MTLKLCEIISLLLLIGVSGMYWGPWLALSRSMATFEPDVFIPLAKRMGLNMAPLMSALVPLALLSTVPVLFFSFGKQPTIFFFDPDQPCPVYPDPACHGSNRGAACRAVYAMDNRDPAR